MTRRRNGIVVDETGAWVAACYLDGDTHFAGTQHGFHVDGTLCGLSEKSVAIVRNPFWGRAPSDCPACASRLRELAD